ncbi:male-enhanced antigen 1-like [Gigantopelta aegis]|uniref:male-enhanced antigen 1-like n=1 Tax=Gigantopelta aegis TaxID=1735272 RepID=UPI001B887753|nr:male-enhanced antigen 1-like [Gigantopelta aegis]
MSPIPDTESESDDNKPTECEDLSSPDLIIPPDPESPEDDDDDDENSAYLGYLPLSQDPPDNNLADSEENGHSDDDDNIVSSVSGEQSEAAATGISHSSLYPGFPKDGVPSCLQVPDLPKPEKKCILWNQTRHESDIQMGQEKVAKIKAAMAGFQLPTTNIPDWAKEISDDEWKEKLVSKISVDSLNNTLDTNSSSTDSHGAGTSQSSKNS